MTMSKEENDRALEQLRELGIASDNLAAAEDEIEDLKQRLLAIPEWVSPKEEYERIRELFGPEFTHNDPIIYQCLSLIRQGYDTEDALVLCVKTLSKSHKQMLDNLVKIARSIPVGFVIPKENITNPDCNHQWVQHTDAVYCLNCGSTKAHPYP